jgi:hypothetical protein
MNYTELLQDVQDYCENDETSFVAKIPRFVRQAEDRIFHSVQLPNFKKNSTGTTTLDNKFLSLPTDFVAPYSLSVLNSGSHEFLIEKDVNFIQECYPDPTASGVPAHYALWDDDTALLGPTPNAALTTEIHYFYKPSSIVDSSTSWLGDNFESALLYGTLIEAYTYMKGEEDVIKLYAIRYDRAMTRLKVLGEGKSRKDAYRSGQLRSAVS